MARLVTKFKYLKPNRKQRAGGYAKYIATREDAEKIDESFRFAPATVNQVKLIQKLVKDFPDTKEMHEYRDYLAKPNAGNATDFISRAIEDNIGAAAGRKTYADYIATRPRAERMGSHGLFTDDGVEVKLDEVSEELNRYNGNVWTVILSLRREDAERLGFGEGKRWRELLRSETPEIAENFKIPMENLQWYAAFHNESHHPHVHLIVYSKLENEGYLTEKGVQNLRSVFARDIFAQNLVSVYEKQTQHRDDLKKESGERLAEIAARINEKGFDDPVLEEKLVRLAGKLSKTKGKKVYGYLKEDVKALVRSVVDDIGKDERIAELYDMWYERREEVIRTYTETLPPRVPLSENREFKSVRNAVICAAMDIVRGTMPDTEQLNGEIQAAEPADKEVEKKYLPNFKTTWQLYFWAKDLLDYENDGYSPHKAAWLLEACAKRGNTVAKYRLGKMYLKGDEIEKDIATALQWLSQAAEDGNEFAEYLLGKTYLKGEDVELDTAKAETYLRRAAGRGNKYAAYTLGKALLGGDVLKQDISAAIRYLKAHADRFRINKEQMGVMGESAGGYLTCMAALDHDPALDVGEYLEESSEVQAACPWYPPTDLSAFPCESAEQCASSAESLLLGFNSKRNREKAYNCSPVSKVTKDAPPFLIIHGNCDRTVPYVQSKTLYNLLEAQRCDVTLLTLDGADHADLQFFQDETWNWIIDFFNRKLK